MMNIEKKNSPNKYNGRNGWKPDLIVCHITEGSYSGAVSWLCNSKSQASAHFVVSREGKITQLVDLRDSAWCNGTSTNPSSNVYYGHSLLEIVRKRKTNANYYTISIEHEGFYNKGHGALTKAQKQATIELINYINDEVEKIYGYRIPIDRQHLVGHYEIAPITKPNCPGEKYPFDEIIKEVNEMEQKQRTWLQEQGEEAIRRLDNVIYDNDKDMLSSPNAWIEAINNPQKLETLGVKDTSDVIALMFIMLDRVTRQ